VILGIVQGLTEFLPVSSSGHLVIAERVLGIQSADLSFPVAVHVGTLAAVIVYFRHRIADILRAFIRGSDSRSCQTSGSTRGIERTMLAFILIASIPAGVIGVLFKDRIEMAFAAPFAAALCLMVTGLWLLASGAIRPGTRPVSWWRAWWIGVAQAIAIIPGISRSGSTIATGMMLGVEPSKAAEFSFLLSIPAVLGATLLSIPDALHAGRFGPAHLVGLIVAALTGYLALRLVFATIRRGRFAWFGVYCLLAGGAAAIWLR
jgi:undecaprenyl-diphosphatase